MTFGKITERDLLTGATPVLTVEAGETTALPQPDAEIEPRTAKVIVTGGGVPFEEVYRQLREKVGDENPIVDYGTVHTPSTGMSWNLSSPGRYVAFEWVQAIDVPFTHTCGGEQRKGTVTTWRADDTNGLLDCDEPPAPDKTLEAIYAAARKLRC